MKPILVFGTGKIADVISFYMMEVSGFEIAAFIVDADHKNVEIFNGKPVFPFEECKQKFNPEDFDFFVAIGYHNLNRVRAEIIARVKGAGYKVISYIHPEAGVSADLVFGENTFIMNNVLIHPRVKLGADNFIWSGAMIGHHSVVGDHNWFTSSCQISGNVTVGDFNFFAVNATVAHSVKIGNDCFFGANTLITKNVEHKSVFIEEHTKPFRLNSDQFLRFSNFSSL